MKSFMVFVSIFTLSTFLTEKALASNFQVKPSDFVVTYLNATFSNNPTLQRDQGLGVMFIIENHDTSPVEIQANFGYFNDKQKTQANQLKTTVQIFYDDLVKRYKLEKALKLKTKIAEVK